MISNHKYEIVGLYPLYGIKGKKLVFSAHVYFIEKNQDVRGYRVHYVKGEDSIIFEPTIEEFDYEEKKRKRFPVVQFLDSKDKKMNKSLKADLINAAEKEFQNFSFPKNFPNNYKKYFNLLYGN